MVWNAWKKYHWGTFRAGGRGLLQEACNTLDSQGGKKAEVNWVGHATMGGMKGEVMGCGKWQSCGRSSRRLPVGTARLPGGAGVHGAEMGTACGDDNRVAHGVLVRALQHGWAWQQKRLWLHAQAKDSAQPTKAASTGEWPDRQSGAIACTLGRGPSSKKAW